MDSRKPVITVWAEENGPLSKTVAMSGPSAMALVVRITDKVVIPCWRLAGLLGWGCARPPHQDLLRKAKVVLAVNGDVVHADYVVTKPDDQYTGTVTFPTPLEVR